MDYSKYVLISMLISPAVFLLMNQIWLRRETRKVTQYWRKREKELTKPWKQSEFSPVDTLVKAHTKRQIQGNELLLVLFILNMLIQPFVALFTLGLAPFTLWVVTLLYLGLRMQKRRKRLIEKGLHQANIVHHERLQRSLQEFSEFRPYISLPYSFLYHYTRLQTIPDQLNEVIRSSKDSKSAKEETEILAEEERWLISELILAFTGRARYYNEELSSESLDAMNTMLRHAQNSELPASVRKRSMELAKKLQSKAEFSSIEEAKKLDALLDIETVERFYIKD